MATLAIRKSDFKDVHIPDEIKRRHPKSTGASDWIGVQPNDPHPILYLSAAPGARRWKEPEFIRNTGCHYRCFSYAYCGFGSPIRDKRHDSSCTWCLSNGTHVFLDSGGHSFHKMLMYGSHMQALSKAERSKYIRNMVGDFSDAYIKYMKWCHGNRRYFDFYVTLDWKKDCPVIWEETKKLQRAGLQPVPVYHGDQSLDWVERYIDSGHKLIGVGFDSTGKTGRFFKRRYYEQIFNLATKRGVSLHGFAATGDMMFMLPWYSVDSTTYLKAAAFGKILDIIPERQRVALVHVSDRYSSSASYGNAVNLPKSVFKQLRDKVESRGFDFDLVRSEIPIRAQYNAKVLYDAVALHSKKPLEWRTWQPLL